MGESSFSGRGVTVQGLSRRRVHSSTGVSQSWGVPDSTIGVSQSRGVPDSTRGVLQSKGIPEGAGSFSERVVRVADRVTLVRYRDIS